MAAAAGRRGLPLHHVSIRVETMTIDSLAQAAILNNVLLGTSQAANTATGTQTDSETQTESQRIDTHGEGEGEGGESSHTHQTTPLKPSQTLPSQRQNETLLKIQPKASLPKRAPVQVDTRLVIRERDGRFPLQNLENVGGLSACAAGDLKQAQALMLKQGWQPHYAMDKSRNTALMWASGGGHLGVVRWLVEEVGVDVNPANKEGRTALMWAAKFGSADVVRYLLDRGADPSARMSDDSTAFDWAVLSADIPTMEILEAEPSVDIGAMNKYGCLAVNWAATSGSVEACRWLQQVCILCLF